MINQLHAEFPDERLTHTIQTNGTVRRWREFNDVTRLDLCVSIDGWRQFHEWHRGKNTYDRTLNVMREAVELGARSVQVRALLPLHRRNLRVDAAHRPDPVGEHHEPDSEYEQNAAA